MKLSRLPESERATIDLPDRLGRMQPTTIISLGGVFRLVLTSRVEGAERFKDFLTSKLLPAWYKRGAYTTAPAPEVRTSTKARIESELSALREQVAKLTAKVVPPAPPVLPAPAPSPTRFNVKAFADGIAKLDAKLEALRRSHDDIRRDVTELGKLPKPEIRPSVVPRKHDPEAERQPYDGKLSAYELFPHAGIGRDDLAMVDDKHRVVYVNRDVWYGWLAGDPQSGIMMGTLCDHYGLDLEVIAMALARLR